MNISRRVSLSLIVISAMLAGCADFKAWHKDDTTAPPDKLFYDTRLYLDGLALDGAGIIKLRQNSEDLNKKVSALVGEHEELGKPEKRPRLRKLLSALDRGQGFKGFVPERMRGLGGFQTRLALKYLVLCSDDQLSSLGNLNIVGKIEKWIYSKKRKSGYFYWHATAPDCFGNDRDYRFHIAVDNGYVEHKNKAKGYDLYFPKLGMELPSEEKERIKKQQRRFDYKLHAEGSSINVLTVFLDNVLIDASDPIYESTEESCIDVLFKGKPPATTLPKQEWYCMGRCDHPPIINTGGA